MLQVPLLQVIGKPSVSTLSDEVVMDDYYNLRKDNIDNHTPKKLIICPKMLTKMSYEVVKDDYNDDIPFNNFQLKVREGLKHLMLRQKQLYLVF